LVVRPPGEPWEANVSDAATTIARTDKLVVGVMTYSVIGWICVAFFGMCAVGSTLAGQYWPVLIFMFFVALGLYMLLSAGHYEFDSVSITHVSWLDTHRIRWDEVSAVETGAFDGTVVLHGANKRFVAAPPA
jgi:hypothetical protein